MSANHLEAFLFVQMDFTSFANGKWTVMNYNKFEICAFISPDEINNYELHSYSHKSNILPCDLFIVNFFFLLETFICNKGGDKFLESLEKKLLELIQTLIACWQWFLRIIFAGIISFTLKISTTSTLARLSEHS